MYVEKLRNMILLHYGIASGRVFGDQMVNRVKYLLTLSLSPGLHSLSPQLEHILGDRLIGSVIITIDRVP